MALNILAKFVSVAHMSSSEPNPRLQRVEYELRSDGIPQETPNKLRSGIHNRGFLPHVKREGASYFVTFRLADSLPKEVLLAFQRRRAERLRALEQARETADTLELIDRDYQRDLERYLDKGVGEC